MRTRGRISLVPETLRSERRWPGDVTETGLIIPSGISREQWRDLGVALKRAEKGLQWCLGDWANYGERKWGDLKKECEEIGLNYGTVKNAAWVASQFKRSYRYDLLSYKHHLLAAPVEEPRRTELLEEAAEEDWSCSRLKKEIRELRPTDISGDGKAVLHRESWKTWLPKQLPYDLLITDPPYMTEVTDIESFAADWLPLAIENLAETGRAYIFIGAYPREINAYLDSAKKCKIEPWQILVWTYKNTIGPTPKQAYILNWQAILYFKGEKASNLGTDKILELLAVQEVNAPDARRDERFYKWQKPDSLAEMFIRHSTKEGDIVIDPFAGSGTFLLAASRLGRLGYGCEIEEGVLELAKKRGCHVWGAEA